MTGPLAYIVAFCLAVFGTVVFLELAARLVLDFRPRDSQIVIAAVVAQLASESVGFAIGRFSEIDITNLTVVSLVLTHAYVAVIHALAYYWIIEDPNGKPMGIANAGLLAIIRAAISLVFISYMLASTDRPLPVW